MRNKRTTPEINSSSMADIAFLLLIFFLVTTQFVTDKGILIQLPPKIDQPDQLIPEREILLVQINSHNAIMVNKDRVEDPKELIEIVRGHVMNHGQDPDLSTKPDRAIVSVKADRGTRYDVYMAVMDAVDQAYNEMYAEKVGITLGEWLGLNTSKSARDRELYDRAKEGLPKQVSLAEPSDIEG